MPRGGRRKGAGRKPDLDPFEELWIVAQCERRFHDVRQKNLEEAKKELFAKSHYLQQVAIFRNIPREQTESWLRSQAGQDYLGDLKAARREMAGLDPPPDADGELDLDDAENEPEGPRVFRITAKQGYRVRASIFAEVASVASERYGKRISPDQVRRYHKRFRSKKAGGPADTGDVVLPRSLSRPRWDELKPGQYIAVIDGACVKVWIREWSDDPRWFDQLGSGPYGTFDHEGQEWVESYRKLRPDTSEL